MPKVICSLPNASESISGVRFSPQENGVISDDVSEDVAAMFLAIPGYTLAPGESAPPQEVSAPAAAASSEQAKDDIVALRAKAEALGIRVDNRWKESRLHTEIKAAEDELAAAGKAADVGDDDQF